MNSITLKGYVNLKVIYEKNLNVDLLAEKVFTCHLQDKALQIKAIMTDMDYDVFGIEENGKVTGYVLREDLQKGTISDFYKPFRLEDLISDSTSIIELLEIMRERRFLFVLEKNKVSKIVTISDLQKQPIRMLAFSLISLLEMLLIELIREAFPDEGWKDKLSEDRLLKADDMLKKRLEKNEALTLLDNIQLGDKGTIVRKTPALISQLGFETTTQCRDFFKNIELLRNNTAHAQDDIYHDYQDLIEIILDIDHVLDRNIIS